MSIFLKPQDRLPVSLLTGFLGSGKTTLLNRLLRHPDMARTAVVINEFGDIALDQLFVEKSDGEVTVLANGCLCCDVQGDLEGVIGTLFGKRDRGEIPGFDRMLIETTGLADPAPVMQMLLNQPLIVDNFRLDAVVTTVDALHGARQLREHEEAVKQVALADRLVLTKTDLAPADAARAIKAELARLNPRAPIFVSVDGDIAPASLFGVDHVSPGHDDAVQNSYLHAMVHDHLHGIETFSLVIDSPIEWQAFNRWLTALKIRNADQLLRVKGILNVAGESAPVAIHGVHHVFHPPERLQGWGGGDRRSRIVFITRGLSREAVEADWRRHCDDVVKREAVNHD
ncbi:MAG: GTP-binding protein [Betaproteobacteria bacterium]|nr:GTP-binding protein [Betaproteobacteria bacterium]